MYPPEATGVAPFGPRNPIASASAPEARMTSFVASQPNASVVRQSSIVIPSALGEKEFEIVVMPRDEYERNYGPKDNDDTAQ
ncbi:hypothetical protein DQ04_05561000 [Trypanosoma grayi]|uniref:hypothetical protein n=1 Tax=Trypanosoma grayi TaxID=71804 RepID=UPI0004F43C79|nr:hypothetical protein DQ04_05561000 [Trypanosoma grayi]KEG09236.1 hypothetical protein DQ04_05561000 [Trypanosoma grayi]